MNKPPLLNAQTLKWLKIPVLSQDEKWLEIIGPYMNEDMQILVKRQSVLIQEETQGSNKLIQLKRQKKEALSQLLGLTDQLQRNNHEAEGQADRIKVVLERIKDEIDQLEYVLETAPAEVQKLNVALLEETIGLGYEKLLADRESITMLNMKIQKLRSELLALNEEKFTLEDEATAVGQYMHALLGRELSNEMDVHYHLSDEELIL